MDPLTRSRRGVACKENDGASAVHDPDYQAALSQAETPGVSGAGISGVPTSGAFHGEASPGTLEQGGVKGSQLPQANPFHSERVKAEVELLRHRPPTLDKDGLRLSVEYDEAALGDTQGGFLQEPDYGATRFSPTGEQGAPRVARVEALSEDAGRSTGVGDSPPRLIQSDLGWQIEGNKGKQEVPGGNPSMGTPGELLTGREAEVPKEDPRELIPADEGQTGRMASMEHLLTQFMEENRSLKRRLEAMERESHSQTSWHSGQGVMETFSPATFGERVGHGVQQFVVPDFPGHEALGLAGAGLVGVTGGWPGSFPGDPHSWRGGRPGDPVGTGVEGSQTMRQFAEEARLVGLRIVGHVGHLVWGCGKGDIVVNRWLTTSAILFRVLCSENSPEMAAELTESFGGWSSVARRALHFESELDVSWIRSALTNASDPNYCLIDSGATNARSLLEAIEKGGFGYDLGKYGWVGNLLSLVQRAWVMWKWEQGGYGQESREGGDEGDYEPSDEEVLVCTEGKDGKAGGLQDLAGAELESIEVLIRTLGEFTGGGLWIEDASGPDRWAISAYIPRECDSITAEQCGILRDLGFPVDEALGRFGAQGIVGRSLVSGEEVGGSMTECAGEWVVGLPVPFIDERSREGWDCWHKSTATLCRLLVEDIGDIVDDPEGVLGLAAQLACAEKTREWLEQCLVEDHAFALVRTLQVEVPLTPVEGAGDQFLQTRTVGLVEARRELDKWKDPAQEEVTSLESTNRAVERVKVGEVDRRCRAVCCGNYLPTDKLGLTRNELYASGAEALSVKVALIFAALHPHWVGVTIDVKSAFLYAPIRSDDAEERIIVKPPSFLTELGILSREDRWWIRKALYGLPTSPRDWGRYRDGEFCKLEIRWEQRVFHLVQTHSDDALWLVRPFKEGKLGDTEGILIVYVDDLAFLGPKGLCQAFIEAVQAKWKTSEPDWLGADPVTFCGIELTLGGQGYRLTQRAYVQELLNRYHIVNESSVPLNKWVEPDGQDVVTAEQVKEAQAITGALLWLSTRTRPDLAYVVSRCGQQATKCPELSISMGKQALAYLKSTIDMGIDVPFSVGNFFSEHGLLALPRTEKVIELYTDASHSPGGERSMQAIFIVWRGVPVAWEVTRQPFTTLSSAESELVCMTHGIQLAEAVQPLVDELVEDDAGPSGPREDCRASPESLALLAVLPRVKGQPLEDRLETSLAWVAWVLSVVIAVVLMVWGWFWVAGPVDSGSDLDCAVGNSGNCEEELGLEALSPSCQEEFPAESPVNDISLAAGESAPLGENEGLLPEPAAEEAVAAEENDEFTEEEWRVVNAKFVKTELETGLTFIQRCRIRKAVARGDVVDPPVFQQRYGPLPSWLGGIEGPDEEEPEGTSPSQGVFAAAEALCASLEQQAEVFASLLGCDAREWLCVGSLAVLFFRSTRVQRLRRLRDLGDSRLVSGLGGSSAVFRFAQGGQGFRWHPVSYGAAVGGSSESQIPWDSQTQIGGSSETQIPWDSQTQIGGSSEAQIPWDSQTQIGGSSEAQIPWDPQSQVGEGSGSGIEGSRDLDRRRAPRPSVQFGGSASSTDPCPVGALGGGSSGSHGMSSNQDAWGLCYEDSFGEDPVEGFPIVGTWLRVHFLVSLFSQEGERILEGLGQRSVSWLRLRAVSNAIRYALAGAIVDGLRRGPYAVMFSSPQWFSAVEEFVLTGYPLEGEAIGEENVPAADEEDVSVLGFPYVEWAPTVVVHFLWRLFALDGSRLLAFLGNRVVEWCYLRSAARGFRSHVLYALIGWLRDTGIQRVADGYLSIEAAESYLQHGVRVYPFEEIEEDVELDERPIRREGPVAPVLRLVPIVQELDGASESEESDQSTTEPSVDSVSSPDGGSELGQTVALSEDVATEGIAPVALGPAYEARDAELVCTYGDDSVVVPLPGWSLADVETIVQGLRTGDWSDFQEMISRGDVRFREGTRAVSVGVIWRPRRVVVLVVLLILCVLWKSLKVVEAVKVDPKAQLREEDLTCSDSLGRELQLTSRTLDVDLSEEEWVTGCDGSVLWKALKAVLLVVTWEVVRRFVSWAFKPSRLESSSQTESGTVLQLPLGDEVRCRGRILFCLWQAGIKIDVEQYPEGIQSEFFGLVGDYLTRVEEGIAFDTDSD
ncbi:RE2 [Symbiodinium sp. CCMP2456]|nr:RE2 [Symbiodinium sp. CCMP2456]